MVSSLPHNPLLEKWMQWIVTEIQSNRNTCRLDTHDWNSMHVVPKLREHFSLIFLPVLQKYRICWFSCWKIQAKDKVPGFPLEKERTDFADNEINQFIIERKRYSFKLIIHNIQLRPCLIWGDKEETEAKLLQYGNRGYIYIMWIAPSSNCLF